MTIWDGEGNWDLYLQTASQGIAGRYVAYFKNENTSFLYPGGSNMADEAEEAGPPRSIHDGPCLARFRNMHIKPDTFLHWLEHERPQFKRSVTRAFMFPAWAHTCSTRSELLASITAAGPPGGGPIRVCAWPKTLEGFLGESLPPQFELGKAQFSTVLMALELPGEHLARWAYLPAALLYRTPQDVKRVFDGAVAQAVNKIEEALDVFRLRGAAAAITAAIDVGAAPGSWTSYLAQVAQVVVAVDPAELAPAVAALPAVRHVRLNSRDPGVEGVVRGHLAGCGGAADLLVCDMNMHPGQACEIVASMLPFLRPGGHVIMTMKMHGIGRDRSAAFDKLVTFFDASLCDHQWVWLLANTKYEATYKATKRITGADAASTCAAAKPLVPDAAGALAPALA